MEKIEEAVRDIDSQQQDIEEFYKLQDLSRRIQGLEASRVTYCCCMARGDYTHENLIRNKVLLLSSVAGD